MLNNARFLRVSKRSDQFRNLFVTIGSIIAAHHAQMQKLVNLMSKTVNLRSAEWDAPEVMATVGPTLERPGDLRLAIEAGARWFRLPCGYRQRPHLQDSRAIREASFQQGVPVRLLLDLPSSRPRTGAMQELPLKAGIESFSGTRTARHPNRPPTVSLTSRCRAWLNSSRSSGRAIGCGSVTGGSGSRSMKSRLPRSSPGWRREPFRSRRPIPFFSPIA